MPSRRGSVNRLRRVGIGRLGQGAPDGLLGFHDHQHRGAGEPFLQRRVLAEKCRSRCPCREHHSRRLPGCGGLDRRKVRRSHLRPGRGGRELGRPRRRCRRRWRGIRPPRRRLHLRGRARRPGLGAAAAGERLGGRGDERALLGRDRAHAPSVVAARCLMRDARGPRGPRSPDDGDPQRPRYTPRCPLRPIRPWSSSRPRRTTCRC